MGGLVEETDSSPRPVDYLGQVQNEAWELRGDAKMRLPPDVHPHFQQLTQAIADNMFPSSIMARAETLASALEDTGRPAANLMPGLMRLAERSAAATNALENARALDRGGEAMPPPRRYLMSDEMRRRLIQEGVGAAVATGVMSQDDLIDRLNQ
jgi:hypothetical protein